MQVNCQIHGLEVQQIRAQLEQSIDLLAYFSNYEHLALVQC